MLYVPQKMSYPERYSLNVDTYHIYLRAIFSEISRNRTYYYIDVSVLGKRHISILPTRDVMRTFLSRPPPRIANPTPPETSHRKVDILFLYVRLLIHIFRFYICLFRFSLLNIL